MIDSTWWQPGSTNPSQCSTRCRLTTLCWATAPSSQIPRPRIRHDSRIARDTSVNKTRAPSRWTKPTYSIAYTKMERSDKCTSSRWNRSGCSRRRKSALLSPRLSASEAHLSMEIMKTKFSCTSAFMKKRTETATKWKKRKWNTRTISKKTVLSHPQGRQQKRKIHHYEGKRLHSGRSDSTRSGPTDLANWSTYGSSETKSLKKRRQKQKKSWCRKRSLCRRNLKSMRQPHPKTKTNDSRTCNRK